MSEENNILVPDKAEKTSDTQRELMLLLNEQVRRLFEHQDDILLYPSPEMNDKELWAYLKLIQENPEVHVGYWFKTRPCADNTSYFWLNVQLTLWITDEKNTVQRLVWLTPNQTHWILKELKMNELLRKGLRTYAQCAITNLENNLKRLSKVVDTDQFWEDDTKFNSVFDVATKNINRRGWYTSWEIFMDNVAPPPPWVDPYSGSQDLWRAIKDLVKRFVG